MTDCSTHSLSGWTNCRLDLFLFIFSRSYLKYPVKIIALYYESVCPTYFLSALQPNPFVLRLFSCHMGWCSSGFLKNKFISSFSKFQHQASTDFITKGIFNQKWLMPSSYWYDKFISKNKKNFMPFRNSIWNLVNLEKFCTDFFGIPFPELH